MWFYALAPNNSSIALASMQAAATSNSERFSPRRCHYKPRAVRIGLFARQRGKTLLSATVASAATLYAADAADLRLAGF